MRSHYLILGLLLAGPLWSSTPEGRYLEQRLERRAFAPESWARTVEGINYDTPVEQPAPPPAERPQSETQPARRPNPETAQLIMKIVSIVGGAVLIALLLWAAFVRGRAPRDRKLNQKGKVGALRLEEIEENLHEADLETYIQQALQQGDYALAVRLYYLAILKELSLSKAIHWKKDKTNQQYLYEMQRSPLAEPFREATFIFERAWYGNRPLGEREYRQIEPKFRALAENATARA